MRCQGYEKLIFSSEPLNPFDLQDVSGSIQRALDPFGTFQQGKSGLGLAVQQLLLVRAFVKDDAVRGEFVACDQPQANQFTVHIFTALAEQKRDLINERPRRALQVVKIQGKLGSPATAGLRLSYPAA